ncbi:AMP-binding protein [Microbacterium sp. cf332]|uniref:AMP-binding protein n=1 Tax=Microbacterium sp. cf332 TaxID=1761804 RepID=UPI00087EF4E0|nr:AMP-binding protein [Microbacterium sp. cf332]SDQ26084.1 O-succinylbenzoic acid--CoA ligase [Microbacterium sp. cf332]
MPVDLVPVGPEPRDVLRALRLTLDGAGPALALGAATAPAPGATAPAGTAAVVTTSGSTGVPKSVVLSRSALIASATATAARIGEGRWLLALAPGYVAGLQVIVRGLLAGHEPAVLAGSFSPTAFAAVTASMHSSVGGHRVPMFTSLVPAQLSDLLDAAETDAAVARALRAYEAILVGGQSLPVAQRERADAAGARIVRTYGSTETSGGCVYDGVPLDGVGVRIADGEVQLSGPVLADGYRGEPERTATAFVVDGGTRWYRTGDAGEFDGSGLRVTGRIDNVIVSGGVNVSLDRVEAVVREQRGCEAAVVVPIADERWGQASAIVVARAALSGTGGDADRLLAGAREAVADRLGKPARPARIVTVERMPVLESGKPDRAAVRRMLAI